jgi:hypothetical protein
MENGLNGLDSRKRVHCKIKREDFRPWRVLKAIADL